MKGLLILIVVVLFNIAAIGQQDSGGYTGVKNAYYEQKSKKILKETPYVHGKKDGVATSYYKNGNLKQEVTYKDGERNGLFILYWKNGNKRFETLFVNNKKTGAHISYYKNGKPFFFVDTNEAWKGYYKSGNIEYECPPHTMDTITWAFKEYYKNGTLKNETVYIKGEVLNQLRKKYDKNGKLKSETPYAWGNKGKTKKFDGNGNAIN